MLLQGALAAEGMVGLKMNVAQKDLEKVMKLLPALKRPTIANLSEPGSRCCEPRESWKAGLASANDGI